MVHIVLDTNIWLYIANNFVNNFKGEGHLKLFEQLHSYQELGYITIYVNEIIVQEWNRNKHIQKEYISKLRHRMEAETELKSLKSIIGNTDALRIVKNEFSEKINLLIQDNENHVKRVEQFILGCIKIPIEDAHKLKTIDLAVHNKPPFHRNKNNVNDTLIMLSFDYYIYNLSLKPLDDAVLISNNKEDFCSDNKIKDFHPEIRKILLSGIKYGTYSELWKILQISEKLQEELNEEIKNWEDENNDDKEYYYECRKCNLYEDGWGELGNSMRLIYTSETTSKSQLCLFKEEEYKPRINTQQIGCWGECSTCGSFYYMCPICYNDINFESDYCSECGTEFCIKRSNDGSYVSSRSAALPPLSPLRTVRAGFLAYGSSNY